MAGSKWECGSPPHQPPGSATPRLPHVTEARVSARHWVFLAHFVLPEKGTAHRIQQVMGLACSHTP